MDEFERLVRHERINQEVKWGEQNHLPELWLAILAEEIGELASSILCDKWGNKKHRNKEMGNELIQVVAVCKAMWECGVRKGWL